MTGTTRITMKSHIGGGPNGSGSGSYPHGSMFRCGLKNKKFEDTNEIDGPK